MVGVAGKSKGCTTCRRRKVKCGGERPTCERCKKAGRGCEGYDRYPVFITKTQDGYVRRKPLEEVVYPAAKQLANPETNVKDDMLDRIFSVSSPDAEAVQLVSSFYQCFFRSPPSKYTLQSPTHWLEYFMDWDSTILPLRQALLAVAVARLSRIAGRPDILRTGRQLYTSSLKMTRKALLDPRMTTHDDILATTCVMTLYEMFDSSTNNIDGWLRHVEGIQRLIQHRGPELHAGKASHAVFEHVRYLIMLQQLVLRRSCVFSEPVWLHSPWQNLEKSVEQQVFDYGFRLASVYERHDVVRAGGKDVDVVSLVTQCMDIFDGIGLLQDLIIWPAAMSDMRDATAPNADSAIFKNPAGVMLSITALAIKLGAIASAHSLYELDPSTRAALDETSHLQDRVGLLYMDRHITARQIISSVQKCADQKVGALGAARMIYALQLVLQQFSPSDPEYQECRNLMEILGGLNCFYRAVMTSKPEKYIMVNGPGSVEDDQSVLAAQWQHLAQICNGGKGAAMSSPPEIASLSCETLKNWRPKP